MIHKVKIYSLPALTYQGTLRMRDPTPEKIAHRMGGKVERFSPSVLPGAGYICYRDGHQIMYQVQENRQEAATSAQRP